MDDSRIKTAAELISAIVSPKVAEEAGLWAQVVGVWPTLVGSRLAVHSRILDVSRNFLVVEADHPGWIQMLQFRQIELLRERQGRFPTLGLRGMQFRLAQKGKSDLPRGNARPEDAFPAEEEDDVPLPHVDPDAIQDDKLRQALLGLQDALGKK